ncbi:SGNH/GDSL hydrolase family protein [Flavobacterium sp. J49]|uniref:SGNH/GDSL hydrolase family protein n=1 Tax=Flavobacterium sp. J49 TaxID=2718534 RepID=UPI001593F85F|nr:SGNH/GDSL hydrolase family protein [Flavobacterium sp. J49]MBF6642087.1 SGNH/GDSL hydrolase family protein [Flavobacterium sp. J49]NIC03334.1 acylhydrolase [Flavobacterium sp. J49]
MKSLLKVLFSITLLIDTQNVISQNDSDNDWANLKKYEMENKTVKPNGKSIVFMGDSITEFWKTTSPSFFASNPFIDRGISGQTTSQMVLRFEQDVINLKPNTVVILAGINDIAENTGPMTLEAIFNNIKSMTKSAKANKIKVVLCSVLPANHFYWNTKIMPADKVIALNKMIKDYAQKNKITYVDYYSAMVDSKKGLLHKYGEDGVHPNLEGYKTMESILLKAL